MNSIVVLFDLDQTLVDYHGTVPRQTWHALRALQRRQPTWVLGIVSNNRLARSLALAVGFCPCFAPADHVLSSHHRTETRSQLIARWFAMHPAYAACPFYYFDDLPDQTWAVAETFGERVTAAVVARPTELYRLLRTLGHHSLIGAHDDDADALSHCVGSGK